MNPIELFTAQGKSTGAWLCSSCRTLYGGTRDGERGLERAAQCCVCRYCSLPVTDQRDNRWRHDACKEADYQKRRLAQRERAQKLETWGGWVYHGDRFFESLEDLVDHLDCWGTEPEDWPAFVYVCKEVPFPGLRLHRAVESLCEDLFDDAYDHLVGLEKLWAAEKEFNAANAHLVSYEPDYTRAVKVPRPEKDLP